MPRITVNRGGPRYRGGGQGPLQGPASPVNLLEGVTFLRAHPWLLPDSEPCSPGLRFTWLVVCPDISLPDVGWAPSNCGIPRN